MHPVIIVSFFPLNRVTLDNLDLEVFLASMVAMAPLGVLAFLEQMDFLAYLGSLYVPAQIQCFVVTKPGFALHATVGKVTPKYSGH